MPHGWPSDVHRICIDSCQFTSFGEKVVAVLLIADLGHIMEEPYQLAT